MERIKEIFKLYNIELKRVDEISPNCYEVETENGDVLIAKNADDKEKIAWEYKTLFNLSNKFVCPEPFKVGDDYIKEALVVVKEPGRVASTYEDKEEFAFELGAAFGKMHITELNEQSSEEELKKVWDKFILNKILFFGTKIINVFPKDVNDQILSYLNDNMQVVKENYDACLVLGKLTNNHYVYRDETVELVNFEDSMIGDPIYDFALAYEYYYDNADHVQRFIDGYQTYMGLPEHFEEKLPFYKLINMLDKILELSDDADKNEEELKNILDRIMDIVTGKFVVSKYENYDF